MVVLRTSSSLVVSVVKDAGFHAVVGLSDGREILTFSALTPGGVGVSSILNVGAN